MAMRPNCECHGVPMYILHRAKGTWKCAVKERAQKARKYAEDPAYRARQLERTARQAERGRRALYDARVADLMAMTTETT